VTVINSHQGPLEHLGSLKLRHLHSCINHPPLIPKIEFSTLSSTPAKETSPFSLSCFYIPIASTTHTVLARAGLQNPCMLKILVGIAGNQIFGERLDATAHLLPERLHPLHPSRRTCVPSEHRDRLDYFPTTICTATTKFGYIEQPWPTYVQSCKRRTQCLRH